MSRRSTRPEAGNAPGAHLIGNTGYQRRLGADDDEVHAQVIGQMGNGGTIRRLYVVHRHIRGDARIARGGDDGVHPWVAQQSTHQRMLPGT